MQQPYKDIENAKRFIVQMQSGLDRIKNPKAKDFQIDALNSFITLVNTFELFLTNKYKLRALDGLLCVRLRMLMTDDVLNSTGICLSEVLNQVGVEMKYSEAMKDDLVHFLTAEEITRTLLKENKITDTDYNDWLAMVDKLLQELKLPLTWS